MNEFAGLLYARPSLVEGAARTLDLGSTFTQYNSMPTPEQADTAAAYADWQAVGEDLRQVMARFADQYQLQRDDDQQLK